MPIPLEQCKDSVVHDDCFYGPFRKDNQELRMYFEEMFRRYEGKVAKVTVLVNDKETTDG